MLRRPVEVDTNDVTQVQNHPPAGQLAMAEFQLTRFQPDSAEVLVQKVASGPLDPTLRQIDRMSPVCDLRLRGRRSTLFNLPSCRLPTRETVPVFIDLRITRPAQFLGCKPG